MYILTRFEWDENKTRTSTVKHGIDFYTASLAFDDPDAISFPERNVEGEERWITAGAVGSILILTAAHNRAQ